MQLKVTFNDADEFVGELRLQANEYAVSPAVVRLTHRHTRAAGGAPTSHLTVVSTFVSGGQLFELACYCGELWHMSEPDGKTKAAAKAVIDKVEAAAKELELAVRPGVFAFPSQ